MLYIVGVVQQNHLTDMAWVYGMDYCAQDEVYQRVARTIKAGVEGLPGITFRPTKELGKISRIDPLGMTDLRVRGMWHIKNPFTVFHAVLAQFPPPCAVHRPDFHAFALINDDKWHTLPDKSQLLEAINNAAHASIDDVLIQDPNNPAKLNAAKLLQCWRNQEVCP